MSASIYWTPTAANKHRLAIGTPSSFIEKLGLPRRFNESWLPWLSGAAAVAEAGEKQAIQKLIEAVHEHGEIDVIVDY